MAKMPKDVLDMYDNPEAVKTIGTVSKQKALNIVPLMSVGVVDEETLGFVDCDLGKTKENLEATKRATITVYTDPMLGYQAKGMFGGWQTSGPVFDKLVNRYKEEASKHGMNITPKAVGTLKITEAYSIAPVAKGFKVV